MSDKKIGFVQLVKAIVSAIKEDQKPKPEEPLFHYTPPKPEPRSPESLEQERRERVYAQQHPEPPVEDHSGERKIDLLEKIQTLEQENKRLRDQQVILRSENTNLSDENWRLRQERDDLAKRLKDADNYIRSHS